MLRKGRTKESGIMFVRDCEATAEEESWSGSESGFGTGLENQPKDWKTLTRGVKIEEWKVRQDFANKEALLETCSFDF